MFTSTKKQKTKQKQHTHTLTEHSNINFYLHKGLHGHVSFYKLLH